ncbi:MAG: hypothetical protein IPI35_06275 [Deltaproteobacteria bacterium]|nr:hypothetical protein [Deltaproteobacteria bacterium]
MLKITAKVTKTTAFATAMALVSVAGLLAVIERKTVDRLEEKEAVIKSGVGHQIAVDQIVAALDGLRILSDNNSFVQAGVRLDNGSLGTSNVYTITGKNSARALHFATGQDRDGRLGTYAHTQPQLQTSQRSAKFALAASGYARKPVAKPRTVNELYEVMRAGDPAPMDPVLKAAALASGAKIYTWTLSDDPTFNAVAAFLNTDGFDSKEEEHADFLAAIVEDLDEVYDCDPRKNGDYPNACIWVTLLTPVTVSTSKNTGPRETAGASSDTGQSGELDAGDPTNEVTVAIYSEVCPPEDKEDCINSEFKNVNDMPINKAMSVFECSFIKSALNNAKMESLSTADFDVWFSDDHCENTGLDFNRGMWWSVSGPDTAIADSASDEFQEFVGSIAFGFSLYNSPALAFCDYNSTRETPLVIYELVIAPDAAGSKLRSTLRRQGANPSLTKFFASWRARGVGNNVTVSSISFRADDDLITLEGQAATELIASCADAIIDP